MNPLLSRLPILTAHLEADKPDGAFHLWPQVGGDDEGRVRISLVHPVEKYLQAIERIRDFVRRNPP